MRNTTSWTAFCSHFPLFTLIKFPATKKKTWSLLQINSRKWDANEEVCNQFVPLPPVLQKSWITHWKPSSHAIQSPPSFLLMKRADFLRVCARNGSRPQAMAAPSLRGSWMCLLPLLSSCPLTRLRPGFESAMSLTFSPSKVKQGVTRCPGST